MIDPPRIANLLSAGQHNLNYFVRKRKIKCVKCVNPIPNSNRLACKVRIQQVDTTTSMIKAGKVQEDWQNFMEDGGLGQEDQEDCIAIHRNETLITGEMEINLRIRCNFLCIFLVLR